MKDLTNGNETKQILQFAAPMLLGNIFQVLYNIIDSIVVGKFIGTDALSAVGTSFPILFVLISLIVGVTSGGSIIISQFFGAKKYDKVKIAIDTLYIVLFITALFVTVVGIVFCDNIFRLINVPENIFPMAKQYLIILLTGNICMFGFYGTNSILRGLGDSQTPLLFMIISSLMNIILDLVFVLIFDMGVSGVAIATVISQTVTFLITIIYLNKTHKLIRFSFQFKFDKSIFITSLKIGLPSGMQNMFVAIGAMALYAIVNPFGTDTIAAYTVASKIDMFAIMPAMNFSMALTAFTGQNMGANKLNRIIKGYKSTMYITSAISVLYTVIAIFFGNELMGVFTNNEKVISLGYDYLFIVCPFYIIFAMLFSNNAVLRGAGDTIIPMFITLFALWAIRIPISYFLSKGIGVNGIWWGIPIAWIVGTVFSFIYFSTGRWKLKAIKQ